MNESMQLYLEACEALGETPRPELTDRSNKDDVSADAYHRLIKCIRYLNMLDGKVWVYPMNGKEYGYEPRWRKDTSGFGFSGTAYVSWGTGTLVGSRLTYRTYNLMKSGVVKLNSFYQDLLSE